MRAEILFFFKYFIDAKCMWSALFDKQTHKSVLFQTGFCSYYILKQIIDTLNALAKFKVTSRGTAMRN